MKTLEGTRFSTEDLDSLCAPEQLNWGVLNEPTGGHLIKLRQKVKKQRQQIINFRNKVAQAQSEKVTVKNAMKVTTDKEQRKIRELEEKTKGQEETTVKQTREIMDLKATKKKCEDQRKRSMAANESLKRE
jgi:hypothetical protein